MAAMTAWERVTAVLTGEAVDRPPVSVWQHFPERDQTAEALADATLAWQARYGCDFVKLMPPGDYATIDWGATSAYRGSPIGTRDTTYFPVREIADWASIRTVPADRGMHRMVVEAARLVDERLGGAVPVLQTIFSPLTTALKLSGGRAIEHLRADPGAVHAALAAIAAVTRQVAAATLERGASGIFFATQGATTDLVTRAEYEEFGARYDLEVLAATAGSHFTLLHLHGERILFDLLSSYPVHALNWHDRRTSPILAEGQVLSGRCVVGGINEEALPAMSPAEAAAQARDAVAALQGRWLMVAPGCVIPMATAPETIAAVVAAARGE